MITIQPILKRLHSPDVFDLEAYYPGDKSCFGFLLQAMFGPDNADGEESFDMIVCTPNWLSKELAQVKILSGMHYIIVDQYDLDCIVSFLNAYALKCGGDTWRHVALKLSRIGKWEFEDYNT